MNIYTPLEKGLGDWITDSVPSSFEDADIVLCPGGSDVDPALYYHSRLATTFVNKRADAEELALLTKSIESNKFLVGICKSSQMLTILAGGWLIQDVTGHHNHHKIQTYDGKSFTVNSSHHQMCYPYDLPEEDYQLLGWSAGISSKYTVQNGYEMLDEGHEDFEEVLPFINNGKFKEPEVIYYPKIRGLAVQFHPEYWSAPKEANGWLNELILKLL